MNRKQETLVEYKTLKIKILKFLFWRYFETVDAPRKRWQCVDAGTGQTT